MIFCTDTNSCQVHNGSFVLDGNFNGHYYSNYPLYIGLSEILPFRSRSEERLFTFENMMYSNAPIYTKALIISD